MNRLVTSRRLSVSAGSNARSTPASTGACAGRHPVRAGRVGDQDLLQVIDDQQQRPLAVLAGLGARPGQQVDQHRLDRLGPLPHLGQPRLDQLPGRRVGPHRRGDRVQDGQRPVVAEHHRHRVVRAAVGDPGGQAGLAQPPLPVQQHPGPVTGPQRPQRLLQLAGGGPRTSPPPPPAPAACGPGTSWCRGWPVTSDRFRVPATSGPPPAGPSHSRARCQSARTAGSSDSSSTRRASPTATARSARSARPRYSRSANSVAARSSTDPSQPITAGIPAATSAVASECATSPPSPPGPGSPLWPSPGGR